MTERDQAKIAYSLKATGLSPPDEPTEAFKAELARIAAKPGVAAHKPAEPKKRKPKTERLPPLPRTFTDTTIDGTPIEIDRISATAEVGRKLLPSISPKPDIRYSPQLADSILSLMAEGFMLVEISDMPNMPNMKTIWRWRQENPTWDAQLTRAREMLGDRFAHKVKVLVENVNVVSFQCDRVKMEGYRWLASKFYPKLYGDKNVHEVSGTVEHVQRHVIDATALSNDQLLALEDALHAANAVPAPVEGELVEAEQ